MEILNGQSDDVQPDVKVTSEQIKNLYLSMVRYGDLDATVLSMSTGLKKPIVKYILKYHRKELDTLKEEDLKNAVG